MTEELKRIDRRTVARYLSRGLVTEKDYDKYLKSLPDLADKVDVVTAEQPDATAEDIEDAGDNE